MSYTPTNWQTGDTVTAEKLNKMEQGIEENAGYWIPLQYSSGTFSVPVGKVHEVLYALQNPDNVFINGAVINGGTSQGGYRVDGDKFYCPLSAEVMEANGMSGTGNIIIKQAVGGVDVSVEVVPDTFIVNLTPTAQDYSGVMDKTVAEINEAFEAGHKIVFRIRTSATEYMDVDCTARWHQSATYPSFNAYIVMTDIHALIFAWTGTTSDPDRNIYSTSIYPLTPMS